MKEAAAGAAVSLLLPIWAGVFFEWAVWITTVVVIVLLAATAAMVLRRRQHHVQQSTLAEQWRYEHEQERAEQQAPPPEPPPTPAPPATTAITHVRLPSSVDEIPFAFACTVHWLPQGYDSGTTHAEPAALAVQAVLKRAGQVTELHHPEDSVAAALVLASALGHPAPDGTNLVTAWATSNKLTVGEEHRTHLQDLSALRRQRQLDVLRIDNERMVRSYLGEEVLTSVGSTVVWWLAQDRTRVRETVDLIGTLAQLSAAANDAKVNGAFQHLLPEHLRPAPALAQHEIPFEPTIGSSGDSNGQAVFVVDSSGTVDNHAEPVNSPDDLLPRPGDEHNTLFGHHLADLLDRHEHSDLADEARHRYGVHEWPTEGTRETDTDD
ncbi:hypothetical protein ACRAKI_05110 [Saccharothrix isguenensis]